MLQQSPDEYGGSLLVATAALEPGQVVSTLPLHECLCVLQGRDGPEHYHGTVHVDVPRVHQRWQTASSLRWPEVLAEHLGAVSIPGADRLVAWLSWLRLEAQHGSSWRTWVDSLPAAADVQLARDVSDGTLERLRSKAVHAQCKAERAKHEGRWQRTLRRDAPVWAHLDELSSFHPAPPPNSAEGESTLRCQWRIESLCTPAAALVSSTDHRHWWSDSHVLLFCCLAQPTTCDWARVGAE